MLKNDVVIATLNGVKSVILDPNRKLWNIGGKPVWEIYSDPDAENLSAIIVDGVNLNEKHQLEGSFYVYYLVFKIIYIALKNGKYRVVYDGKFIGPEYDEILMSDGDGSTVFYGHEQYWFWGSQEGHIMWLQFTNLPTKPRPTQRALDWRDSSRFQAAFCA